MTDESPTDGRTAGVPGPTARAIVDGRLRHRARELVSLELLLVSGLAFLVWPTHRTNDVDEDIATSVFARPGTGWRGIATFITTLGSPGVVAIASACVATWAWRRFCDPWLAVFCPVSVLAAALIEHSMKLVVGRPRPATAVLANQFDNSYPSGHATAASAFALAAGLLVWATGSPRRRALTAAVLGAYALAVAASRVVLGVHYLSDVVGAAALGTAAVISVGWLWPHERAGVHSTATAAP